MHIELLKLVPAVKNYFWGGKKLAENWNKKSSSPKIAETWELSLHPDGLSKIEGGSYDGKTLKELLDQWGDAATGKSASLFPMFPMLVKFIDTSEKCSIQVHPDDDYAHKNEMQFGKNEAWYILEAEEGAGVYLGFKKTVTKDEVLKNIENGTLLDLMQFYPVKPGDVFYVPARTVHCVGAGITFVEIEKNSNANYRLYDFDRLDTDGKKRELHIQKALDVANLGPYTLSKIEPENKAMRQLVTDRYFTVREIKSASILKRQIDDSFCAILFLEGEGEITDGINKYQFKKGDTFFAPAKIAFKITGNTRFLEIFV
ncbi:MAG TPA: type I phosphomannose isomerase catalytic subunit [Clostridia bacterium]